MTNGDGRQKETPALKVLGGAVTAERKNNEGRLEGERGTDSSIIEGNRTAAAERGRWPA